MSREAFTPPSVQAKPASHRRFVISGLFLSAGIIALVFAFDPASVGFFPKCIFHQLTGLHCPGCGATRSLHALLHGQIEAAIRYNLFFVFVGVPAGIWVVGEAILKLIAPARRPRVWPKKLGLVALIVAVLFGVLRNLPAEPFSRLAPPTVPVKE